MENVEVTVTEDEKLVLVVDLKREIGLTNYRNNVSIATSGGNINLWHQGKPRQERFNINVFRPLTKQEKREGKVFFKSPSAEDTSNDENE